MDITKIIPPNKHTAQVLEFANEISMLDYLEHHFSEAREDNTITSRTGRLLGFWLGIGDLYFAAYFNMEPYDG